MDDEIWMTAPEAADHFGVSNKTIYRWTAEGRLQVGGLDERGQKLFRFLDVAQVELVTRARAKRVLGIAA
ncbi:helix-turn-helix domain-containing protein [Streptomyces sp. NPDC021020]|uniref:helix-turn-helix domain-containing protein n=1 Tax=Streptomyces sp. NPDC021020 TaxID=3365109 RepID=UPI0037BC09C0